MENATETQETPATVDAKALAISQITALMAEFGIQQTDLFPVPVKVKGKRASPKPKYRNPNNPEQTWTGRGKMPLFMKALVAEGIALESMRI